MEKKLSLDHNLNQDQRTSFSQIVLLNAIKRHGEVKRIKIIKVETLIKWERKRIKEENDSSLKIKSTIN